MKTISLFACTTALLLAISCGNKGQNGQTQNSKNATGTESPSPARKKPWPPMRVQDLLQTPFLKNRVAVPEDVRKGLAVFSFHAPPSIVHKALPLPMPHFAYRKSDAFADTVLVIFQVERLGNDTIMGWRNAWNEYGQDPIHNLVVGTTGKPFRPEDFSGYAESHEETLLKKMKDKGAI